ncbi:MAG: pantetheine-phosphate adenylyltransferase [Planctomycetes bacterium]|nr:pantetheine-phosphate adenylyltransferase [Planctomycetota bacterium]MCB9910609.1 pantetheine-phosphate adenylyltransferase [Planctomycetota bacterium]
MNRASLAVFPGTFDPFTLGHLDLCTRGLKLFDRVVIAVAQHHAKGHLFDPETRLAMIQACTSHLEGVDVRFMEGLLVEGCRALGATAILRGVRTAGDLDYERQMALTNRAMLPEVETVLVFSAPEHAHISSTLVRQIAQMGGDVAPFVPPPVLRALQQRSKD